MISSGTLRRGVLTGAHGDRLLARGAGREGITVCNSASSGDGVRDGASIGRPPSRGPRVPIRRRYDGAPIPVSGAIGRSHGIGRRRRVSMA